MVKVTMLVCSILAFMVVGLPPALAEQCGEQADGALCPGGMCCSQWGWCGNTPTYCGNGCQSQCEGSSPPPPSPPPPPPSPPPPPPAGECGEQADGALCSDGLCCSQWGWCGNTPAYCGDGCQSQCEGPSPPPPSPSPPPPSLPPPPPAGECGEQADGALCPNELCCSQWGWCGNTAAYCGDGCQSQCEGPSPPPPSPPPPPPSPPPPPPAGECGEQADGALCPDGLCCSEWGWCGNTSAYCGDGCQSQCGGPSPPPPTPTPAPTPTPTPTPSGPGVASIITENVFNEMLMHRNDVACPARDFYNYNAFIAAANAFNGFGTTGNAIDQRRELAAFFGQTSHETTGRWSAAPDGPFAWGYCYFEEIGGGDYCNSQEFPCSPGKQYYGRGPMQLSWNYNYIAAGDAIGFDGLNDPDIVARDPTIAFKTAIWFWMTAQSPKPSCHDVITGSWSPSNNDVAAGRVAGYGMTTNIINGGLECAQRSEPKVDARIGFYKRYCDMLGVSYGDNLGCYNQSPYGVALRQITPNHIKRRGNVVDI